MTRLGLSATTRVTILSSSMALSSVVLAVVLHDVGAVSSGHATIPAVAFVALFAFTEFLVVHIDTRGGTYTISFSESPLVVGLALASPVGMVAGRVIGTGLSLRFYRRQPTQKLLFNLSMIGLETFIAVGVYRLVLGSGNIVSFRGVVAGFSAGLAANTFSAIAVTGVIWASSARRPSLSMLRQVLFAVWLSGGANAAIGVGAVASITSNPWMLLLLGGTAMVLFLLYRANAQLGQRYTSLATLHEFTRELGGSLDLEVVATTVLAATRRLLRSRRADLVLLPIEGSELVWVRDVEGTVTTERVDAASVREMLEPLLAVPGARLVDPASLPAFLDVGAVRGASVSTVDAEDGVLGLVLAIDRDSDVIPFDDEDITLFETLTNSASVSIQKSALFARLQAESSRRLHQALHDPLTGLPNRNALEQRLTDDLALAKSNRHHLAVVLIDLDGFKEMNDTLGHQAGDALLRNLGRRLASRTPDDGHISRFGGDEFVLVFPCRSEAEALRRVSPIVSALDEPVTYEDMTLAVGGRMGIALYPQHGEDVMTLLQRADVAMYDARASLTSCEVYDPTRDPFTPHRLALMGELRDALARGEIEVWFQPQQDLMTGEITGAEALVRWRHRERGLLEAGEWIGFTEKSGLSRPLARHVLRSSLEHCRAWRDDGHELTVSVNLSVRNLLDPELPRDVDLALRSSGLPPGALTLEVTETGIMTESRRAEAALAQLEALGVLLSIDDFGTGYSNLARLRDLPVSELKIDKAFVGGALMHAEDEAIVVSTVELAHRLGLQVVAEGAETEETLAWLRSLGCDTVQGYVLSRALPPQEFNRWLAERKRSRLVV